MKWMQAHGTYSDNWIHICKKKSWQEAMRLAVAPEDPNGAATILVAMPGGADLLAETWEATCSGRVGGYVREQAASSSELASKRPRTASSTFSPGLEIVLLIRGEWSREGRRTEPRTTGSMQVFEENMRSALSHMVQPLERECRDLKVLVLVFADLMGDPEREFEARENLVRVFGEILKDARVSQFLKGRDQVTSMMSSLDFCMACSESELT